jgi:ABC-type oligopeptide transport system substrate-binding subunit
VDWTDAFNAKFNEEVGSRKDLISAPFFGTAYLRFDLAAPPYNDRNVRKAISASIDRKTLAARMSGKVIPAESIVPPFQGYAPQPGEKFDPEVARSYLAKAGFVNAGSFPEIVHSFFDPWIKMMLQLNLGMTFRKVDGDLDYEGSWWGDYSDPATMLSFFLSTSSQNPVGYSNPLFDSLIHKAETQKGEERLKLLMEAEKILITQDQAVIPLYHMVNDDLIDLDKWGGWYPSPLGIHPVKFFYRK